MKSSLRNVSALIFASVMASSIFQSTAFAAPVCATVWVGNFGGAGAVMTAETNMLNLHNGYYARRTWHGGFRQGWSGKDRPWSEIRSAAVSAGCTLYVNTGANLDGASNMLPEGQTDANAFPNGGNVGSLSCTCRPVIEIDKFGGIDFMRGFANVMPSSW